MGFRVSVDLEERIRKAIGQWWKRAVERRQWEMAAVEEVADIDGTRGRRWLEKGRWRG